MRVRAGEGADPYVGRFLLWATLGNVVVGSVFIALFKYGHARPEAPPE
jgi:formate/nitrite transporter FocA (FNT family)